MRVVNRLSQRSALAALVFVSQVAVCQALAPVQRSAVRVTLSNGQIINVLSTIAPRPTGRISTVLFIGDAGAPVVFSEEADTAWNEFTLSIADGGRKITARFHIGYVVDGMAGPAELQMNGTVFRWLSKGGGEITSQQRAMQKAIAGLPEDFRKDIVTFAELCSATAGELVLPPSGFIVPELFAETLPRLATQSIIKLNSEEATKIFQESTADPSR